MTPAADRQELLASCGVEAQLDGGATMMVMPPRWATPRNDLRGDRIESSVPVITADSDDIDRLDIEPGEDGTVITVQGKEYVVLSIDQERNGFCVLELGAA